MAECTPDSLSILGTHVCIFDSYGDAVELIRQRIRSHSSTFCVAINPEKVYRAKGNPRLRQALDSAHIGICDGVGISLAAMLLYRRRLPRCTGIDLFLRLIRLASQEGWKVFLLGASPQSNEDASRALVSTYPGVQIAGKLDGYFQDTAAVVATINRSGADLLFVAMGSPRQELWIREQMPFLKTRFCMGIGGSLDVVSGAAKRAPVLFRTSGTEWLFRLLSDPSRLRRQMVLPLFMLEVLRAKGRGSILTRA